MSPDLSPERRALYDQPRDHLSVARGIAGSRGTPLKIRVRALKTGRALADTAASLLRDMEPDHIESETEELEGEEEEARIIARWNKNPFYISQAPHPPTA